MSEPQVGWLQAQRRVSERCRAAAECRARLLRRLWCLSARGYALAAAVPAARRRRAARRRSGHEGQERATPTWLAQPRTPAARSRRGAMVRARPRTGGQQGARAVELLETCQPGARRHGQALSFAPTTRAARPLCLMCCTPARPRRRRERGERGDHRVWTGWIHGRRVLHCCQPTAPLIRQSELAPAAQESTRLELACGRCCLRYAHDAGVSRAVLTRSSRVCRKAVCPADS